MIDPVPAMRPGPFRFLLFALLLAVPSCTTFDRHGRRAVAALESPASAPAFSDAIVGVFGREGFTVVVGRGNPLVFSRKAAFSDRLIYQDLSGSEMVNRASVFVDPTEAGSRAEVRATLIHRPGTVFETNHFLMPGTGSYYKGLLEKASAQAVDAPLPLLPEPGPP